MTSRPSISLPKVHETRLIISAPRNFSFWRTAYSHGWCDLPPFSYDVEQQELRRVLTLDGNTLVDCRLRGNQKEIHIDATSDRPPTSRLRTQAIAKIRTILRLDEDFAPFHSAARKNGFAWIARSGAGRLLRAPTVFEDVVKMICTTNCTWALTKIMVTNIGQAFGKKSGDDHYAFPEPAAIAGSPERFMRAQIKAGYRSPYLIELAERVASGKLDIESWRHSSLPTDQLFKSMLEVKGIGPYAAGNILKLVGRYDYLGLDSWVRQQYYKLHRNGRKVKDSTIEQHYAKFGEWRGLFFWLEMTRDWHDEKFAA